MENVKHFEIYSSHQIVCSTMSIRHYFPSFSCFSPETPYLMIKCLYISDDNNVKPSVYNLRKMLSILTYFKQPKFTAQK